jgi:hypothetical protein
MLTCSRPLDGSSATTRTATDPCRPRRRPPTLLQCPGISQPAPSGSHQSPRNTATSVTLCAVAVFRVSGLAVGYQTTNDAASNERGDQHHGQCLHFAPRPPQAPSIRARTAAVCCSRLTDGPTRARAGLGTRVPAPDRCVKPHEGLRSGQPRECLGRRPAVIFMPDEATGIAVLSWTWIARYGSPICRGLLLVELVSPDS